MATEAESVPERCSTGVDDFDGVIGGGYPRERSILVAGGPGTGKSSLAMAFLAAGAAEGERCLFVATEQTVAEARAALEAQGFDLDREGLAIASLQETVAEFVEGSPPAPAEVAEQLLSQYAPRDRIAFDDVPALTRGRSLQGGLSDEPIGDGEAGGATAPIDGRTLIARLVHTATRELTATTLLTAGTAGGTPVGESGVTGTGAGSTAAGGRSNDVGVPDLAGLVHGIVGLTRERVAGDVHRTLRVEKLRGVDHDRRTLEFHIEATGPRVVPSQRSVPGALTSVDTAPVGVDGLDELCGGGLLTGGGVLLRHDGRVNLSPLLAPMLASALERGYAVELVPTVHLRESRLRTMLAAFDYDLDELLAADRLFVFDLVDAWESGLQNVFGAREELAEIRSMLTGIADRTDGPHFRVVNADALAHTLGPAHARALRHYQAASLVGDEDQLVHVQHPTAVSEAAVAAYEDAAEQILSLAREAEGREYVTLEKSPVGDVGQSAVISYTEEAPYVEVQRPPASG